MRYLPIARLTISFARGHDSWSDSKVSLKMNIMARIVEMVTNMKVMVMMTQGCINRGTCSHPELTQDQVLTSAYVIQPARETRGPEGPAR